MAGVSSLLKSAASTRKKVLAQEDAFAAYDWENSAQSYTDFLNYSKYLQKRQSSTTDPSDKLSYATKMRSAQRTFTSNEIQRQTQAVQEGRSSTQDKMKAVYDLWQRAASNGDYNLAQNLVSTYDALSIQLQNEQKAAASSIASADNKSFNTLIKSLKSGNSDVTLPGGTKVTPLSAIANDLQQTGGSTATWQAASDTLEAIRGIVIDRYNNATTQEQIDSLESKYGPGLEDLDKKLNFNVGGKNLSMQDVVNAEANAKFNNPLYGLEATSQYNPLTGKSETTYKLKQNNVDNIDYVRQIDPKTGQETFLPAQLTTDQNRLFFGNSDQGRGLGTQITNAGEVIGGGNKTGQINAGTGTVNRDEGQTIGNRLKALGIDATQNGTTLFIKLPGENVQRSATIQPDGSIRYFDDNGQLNEIGLVDRNLGTTALPQLFSAGQSRVVSPDEISDFGTLSPFGGLQSQASPAGARYVKDITSPIERVAPTNLDRARLAGFGAPTLSRSNINIGNDFSGFGSPVTSSLLQSASFTRQQAQLQAQQQAMLQAQQAATKLQASSTFNLNQTPVRQLAVNGVLKNQLKVVPLPAQPRVVVGPPLPQQKINKVNVATNVPRITSVGNY
jgi:hypothetical protein